MAYRHALAPAKGAKTHRHGRNPWVRHEWRVCPTCGGRFWCTHNRKIFCNEKCAGARLTEADKRALNLFVATCARYRLSPRVTFAQIAHCDLKQWFRFSAPEKYGHIGKERKDRFLAVLKKFIADLRVGLYDIERRPGLTPYVKMLNRHNYGTEYRSILTRRMTPGQPYCPMKLSHCRGALLPPDCPRQSPGCPMSAD